MKSYTIQIGSCFGEIDSTDPIFQNLSPSDNVILIEPVKFLFDKLVENYNHKYPNNNFIFINKAVSTYNGILKIYVPSYEELISKRNNDKDRWCWGIASVNKSHPTNHWGQIKSIDEIEIECITLESLIQSYEIESIDILHTDTEGHDVDILSAYDYKIKPNKIIFENAHTDGTRRRGIKYQNFIQKMEKYGYSIIKETHMDTTLESKSN